MTLFTSFENLFVMGVAITNRFRRWPVNCSAIGMRQRATDCTDAPKL